MRYPLAAAAALCIAPFSAYATDAPSVYTTVSGKQASLVTATSVCGVSSDGTPTLCDGGGDARLSFKTRGGLTESAIPIAVVCSVDSAGVPQLCGNSSADLSGYLTKADAGNTYVPLSSMSAYATKEQLDTVESGVPDAVTSAIKGFEGSVTGDVSTAGSSITLVLPDSGVQAVLAYSAAGAASMTFSAVGGTVTPVDIRRNTIWGGSAVETFTLDGGTLTTAGTVADSTIYTASNDSSAYFIRANGNIYFLTAWVSGNGARAFMGYHKMI